jgi:hypothetical protein
MTDSGVLRSRSSNARQARKTVNRHRPLEFGSELQVSSQDRLLQFEVVIFHPTVETRFAHGSRRSSANWRTVGQSASVVPFTTIRQLTPHSDRVLASRPEDGYERPGKRALLLRSQPGSGAPRH